MSIQTEISVGELLDKITILQIKQERIGDPEKLLNINRELDTLLEIWKDSPCSGTDLDMESRDLKKVNETLWEIEDAIRDKESRKEFDKEFIELARSVYRTNDERARIKKIINRKTGSDLIEEKSYKEYR